MESIWAKATPVGEREGMDLACRELGAMRKERRAAGGS